MRVSALFTFITRPSFFVSYAREEGATVEPIVKILRAANRKVFFDQDSIRPGSNWRIALHDALDKAKAVFLFWSKNAAESAEVEREWRAALEGRKAILSVLLDNTPLPPELRPFQWIDARKAQLNISSELPGLAQVDHQVTARVARSNLRVALNYVMLALLVSVGTGLWTRPSYEQIATRQISPALSQITFSRQDDETRMTRAPIINTPLARSGIRYFLNSGTASLERLSSRDRDHLLITVRLRGSYHEEHFRGNPGDINNRISHRHEPTGLVDLAFERGERGWAMQSSVARDFIAEARAQQMMIEAGLPKVKDALLGAIPAR